MDATIAALAKQGLKRCRSEDIASGAGTTPAINGAVPDLLKDPFLNTDPDQVRPAPADVVTAMPWLSSDADLEINPTTEESSEDNVEIITPSPKPTLTPEANSDAKIEVEMANKEPALSEEEPLLITIEPAPQSLPPRRFWNTHGSAFNSSLKSKAPPTPGSRWG